MTDFTAVKNTLRSLHIETPSWAYGNSGTRFKVFAQPGAADRSVRRRSPTRRPSTASPAACRRWRSTSPGTGSTATRTSRQFAAEQGIGIGSVNANTFQDEDYRLGSVCNPDPRIRRKATDHLLECVEIAEQIGSRHLTLWFADGTNYAGQDSISGAPGPPRRGARRDVRGDARERHDAARVQDLRARVLLHRPARLGHEPAALPAPRRARAGAGRHRPPRAAHEHRDDRGAAARPGPPRRLPLQQPVLRRRRSDGRRGRSVPAVPDHVRDRPGRRDLERRRLHARPVPQHRAQGGRSDPVRDERAGGDCQGAAGRPARARRSRSRPATCSARMRR